MLMFTTAQSNQVFVFASSCVCYLRVCLLCLRSYCLKAVRATVTESRPCAFFLPCLFIGSTPLFTSCSVRLSSRGGGGNSRNTAVRATITESRPCAFFLPCLFIASTPLFTSCSVRLSTRGGSGNSRNTAVRATVTGSQPCAFCLPWLFIGSTPLFTSCSVRLSTRGGGGNSRNTTVRATVTESRPCTLFLPCLFIVSTPLFASPGSGDRRSRSASHRQVCHMRHTAKFGELLHRLCQATVGDHAGN